MLFSTPEYIDEMTNHAPKGVRQSSEGGEGSKRTSGGGAVPLAHHCSAHHGQFTEPKRSVRVTTIHKRERNHEVRGV